MADTVFERLDWKGFESISWGDLAPLKLRAKQVADGLYAGQHRSLRRGSGVEFAGHRTYTPGDELRFIDVRASMRHERIVVRVFETETERALRLVVDATRSMAFRSKGAKCSKLAYSALIASALARVALASGDPVGLDWFGGSPQNHRIAPSARGETFERVIAAFESAQSGGDARMSPAILEDGLGVALRNARRGSAIVLFSDLLDLPDDAEHSIGSLALRGRSLAVVEVLDPEEATFPFEGPIILRAAEASEDDVKLVQTDGPSARAAYLEALSKRADHWRDVLFRHGGVLVRATTDLDPVHVCSEIVQAIANPASRA